MTTFEIQPQPIPEYFNPTRRPWLESLKVPTSRERGLPGRTIYSTEVRTISGHSALFDAFGYAFNAHCPLVIAPDSIWLTALVGLSHHIDTDPEGLRRAFVTHEGKEKLEFKAGGTLEGADRYLWEAGIESFSAQIKDRIHKGRHELIVSNFSTSKREDIISSEVALMGAMKHYFEYKMILCCGFSSVTIEGTQEDWGNIIDRVYGLGEFGLGWWADALVPVLREIKRANAGEADVEFWKRAYVKHGYGSGGDYKVSGWVNTFFPYISGESGMRINPSMNWESESNNGIDSDDYPVGLVSAPVEIDDNGIQHRAEFYGGLVGVSMGDNFVVKPESGIAIQLVE